MKRAKASVSLAFFLVLTIVAGPVISAGHAQGFMYQEFDGIYLYFIPKDPSLYRELLPQVFEMPEQPLVWVFVVDYYKTAPWFIEPYREVAFFLLGRYRGEEVWHCLTMPVTSERARIGGIRNLGYPKVLAEIDFVRQEPQYLGKLMRGGQTIVEISLDARDRTVSDKERDWFKRLTGIPSLNFRNGKLIDPVPAARKARANILELSERMPETFRVKVGKAQVNGLPQNAPLDSDWRPKVFELEPREIVLAYYFQNKYGFSFGVPKTVSE